MLNLTLHCGGQLVDRHDVQQTPTPSPTETWQPIPHHDLLTQVESTLTAIGLNPVNHAHALARDGLRYFGLLEVTHDQADEDYGLIVGLRNSHDRSYPAGLTLGSQVFCCDNLSFSGEVVLARRHTRFILRDLPQLVQVAVGRLGELRHQQADRIESYKQRPLEDRDAHHLLIQLVESGALPVTRLPVALGEYHQPRYDEFLTNGQRTAWTLMNAVTESLKGRNLDALPRRTQAMHGLLDTPRN